MIRSKIFTAIEKARNDQDKQREQREIPWTCNNVDVSNSKKLSVLLWHIGLLNSAVLREAMLVDAYELGEEFDHDRMSQLHSKMKESLINIAATCVAWLEAEE
jgi:hypothetical protein